VPVTAFSGLESAIIGRVGDSTSGGIEEARVVLGLADSDEPTRDRVRRAYLRKLREHSPERDPAGFQRLRAAYEMLQQIDDFVSPPITIAPAPRPSTTPAPEPSDEPTPETPALDVPALDARAPDPTAAILDLHADILQALDDNRLDDASDLAAECRALHADAPLSQPVSIKAAWVLIGELVYVSPVLPTEIVHKFVDALRTADPSQIQASFTTYAMWDAPKVADLEGYLLRRAPALMRWGTGRARTKIDPKRVAIALAVFVAIVVAAYFVLLEL